jgi:thiamine pyrophosphate-dependent acetolactate synthase large subunit-like protein
MKRRTGADRLCEALQARGVGCVFGLPGSQTIPLYEAVRQSGLRAVGATHELAASFMANGYARASGRPGVLTTIPGPGFTYSLTGLAEARLDSAPLLHVTTLPADSPGRRFQLQALDQAAIAAPLVKAVVTAHEADEVGPRTLDAFDLTMRHEPGPVLLQVAHSALVGAASPLRVTSQPEPQAPDEAQVAALARRLVASRRPLLYLGQGAAGAADGLDALARRLACPVVTTTSGRGILPEDDSRVLVFDGRGVEGLNRLVAAADLVLALGCKLSHNGAHGFDLVLPPEKLVHVDASPEVLGANYPCSLALESDVPALVRALEGSIEIQGRPSSAWSPEEWARFREGGQTHPFFDAMRTALPRDGILVTDSGRHQTLARRHFRVLAPRGFIVPADLQSMGFALPAAIGAALAAPQRRVVALLGDGGLLMSGLELATAAYERQSLAVLVSVDGGYSAVREKQLRHYGRSFGTDFPGLKLSGLAVATGASHVTLDGERRGPLALAASIAAPGPVLVGVRLRDTRPGGRSLRGTARRLAAGLGLLGVWRRFRS